MTNKITNNETDITSILNKEEDGVEALKRGSDIQIQQYLKLLSYYLAQKQKYNITRKEICRKTKLSYMCVYKIDTCQSIPQVDTLLKLLDAVDCVVEFNIKDKRASETIKIQ